VPACEKRLRPPCLTPELLGAGWNLKNRIAPQFFLLFSVAPAQVIWNSTMAGPAAGATTSQQQGRKTEDLNQSVNQDVLIVRLNGPRQKELDTPHFCRTARPVKIPPLNCGGLKKTRAMGYPSAESVSDHWKNGPGPPSRL
jgi:hypothetical protein